MKTFLGLFGIVVCMPISLYITYSLLVAINADRLLWFLFWVNIPFIVFLQIGVKLLESKDKK